MADVIPPGGNGVDPEKEQQVEESAKRILQEGATTEPPSMPENLRFLPEKLQLQEIELRKQYAKQELDLRHSYASGLLIILAFQLIVADVVFVVFAEVGQHWKLSDGVIQVWLAAVVVQVVGVVTVVTRHLFPNRDKKPDPPAPAQPPG